MEAKKIGLPIMHQPCKNCPFRTDVAKGWLGRERATEIAEAKSFVCHKTVNHEEPEKVDQRKQCAGFMLMREVDSIAVTTARMLGIDLQLKGAELVFKTKEEFIKHHEH